MAELEGSAGPGFPGICLLESKMQDLTHMVIWDGSYLGKYHFERILRKIPRKHKRNMKKKLDDLTSLFLLNRM